MKNKFTTLASSEDLQATIIALSQNGITAEVAKNASEAKEMALELIPKGAEVMTATSKTLEKIGLDTLLNDSGGYNSVKSQLKKLNREKDGLQMQKIGAAPEYMIGSVHAITRDGKVIVASGSGSQLPGYSYGAPHVVWVVSTKKIVKNIDEGMERIYKHILPLEDARMKEVYGPEAGSNPRKILIFNAELNPNRIRVIFVTEDLGF